MFRLYLNWRIYVLIDKAEKIICWIISLYLWVFTKNHGCINSNILHRKTYLICFDIKIIAIFVP